MHQPRLLGTIAAGALLLSMAGPVAATASDAGALQLVILDDAGSPEEGQAWVRVLHGSPDAPEVDVYVGADVDTAAKVDDLSGLSFAENSEYVQVPAGTYGVKVCATADDSICPITVEGLVLEAGKKYTVVASNVLADIEATVVVDGATAEEGKGHVRVAHFSSDTPAVDVLVQDKSAAVVDGAAYKDVTDYLALDPDDYDLIICADADNDVCPLDPDAITVSGGMQATVYAIGSLETLLKPSVTSTEQTTSPLAVLLVLAGAVVALFGARRLATVRASR